MVNVFRDSLKERTVCINVYSDISQFLFSWYFLSNQFPCEEVDLQRRFNQILFESLTLGCGETCELLALSSIFCDWYRNSLNFFNNLSQQKILIREVVFHCFEFVIKLATFAF